MDGQDTQDKSKESYLLYPIHPADVPVRPTYRVHSRYWVNKRRSRGLLLGQMTPRCLLDPGRHSFAPGSLGDAR